MVKELLICNNSVPRKDLTIRITTEPAFVAPTEIRLQSLAALAEHCITPIDIKLNHSFLAELNERLTGWLRVEVIEARGESEQSVVVQTVSSLIEAELECFPGKAIFRLTA